MHTMEFTDEVVFRNRTPSDGTTHDFECGEFSGSVGSPQLIEDGDTPRHLRHSLVPVHFSDGVSEPLALQADIGPGCITPREEAVRQTTRLIKMIRGIA